MISISARCVLSMSLAKSEQRAFLTGSWRIEEIFDYRQRPLVVLNHSRCLGLTRQIAMRART
jgi:hypothetical protein